MTRWEIFSHIWQDHIWQDLHTTPYRYISYLSNTRVHIDTHRDRQNTAAKPQPHHTTDTHTRCSQLHNCNTHAAHTHTHLRQTHTSCSQLHTHSLHNCTTAHTQVDKLPGWVSYPDIPIKWVYCIVCVCVCVLCLCLCAVSVCCVCVCVLLCQQEQRRDISWEFYKWIRLWLHFISLSVSNSTTTNTHTGNLSRSRTNLSAKNSTAGLDNKQKHRHTHRETKEREKTSVLYLSINDQLTKCQHRTDVSLCWNEKSDVSLSLSLSLSLSPSQSLSLSLSVGESYWRGFERTEDSSHAFLPKQWLVRKRERERERRQCYVCFWCLIRLLICALLRVKERERAVLQKSETGERGERQRERNIRCMFQRFHFIQSPLPSLFSVSLFSLSNLFFSPSLSPQNPVWDTRPSVPWVPSLRRVSPISSFSWCFCARQVAVVVVVVA